MLPSVRLASWLLALALWLLSCARAPSRSASPASIDAETRANAELARVGLSIRELSSDVFLAVHQSPNQSSANLLIVRVRDGSVVICSSPYDTAATRALVRYLRARFQPPRIVAINTHFHADGTAGNEGYTAEGVETFASDHTVTLQAERGAAGLEGMARYIEAEDPALAQRIRATHVLAAQHVFSESQGVTLTFGAEPVRVLFVGAGHSPDNLVVHFPERGVLFGGCMVRAHPGLGNTKDADLVHWATTAEAAARLGPRIVVPGHGEPGGPELLAATATAVREHADAGAQ